MDAKDHLKLKIEGVLFKRENAQGDLQRFMNLYMDLSYFYNKAMIDMPPPHWLLGVRMWILGFFSIIAANDYYDYISERRLNSMTLPVFLIFFIIGTEWMLFYKNMQRKRRSLSWTIY